MKGIYWGKLTVQVSHGALIISTFFWDLLRNSGRRNAAQVVLNFYLVVQIIITTSFALENLRRPSLVLDLANSFLKFSSGLAGRNPIQWRTNDYQDPIISLSLESHKNCLNFPPIVFFTTHPRKTQSGEEGQSEVGFLHQAHWSNNYFPDCDVGHQVIPAPREIPLPHSLAPPSSSSAQQNAFDPAESPRRFPLLQTGSNSGKSCSSLHGQKKRHESLSESFVVV
jgi:hypothetical protein